MSGHGFTSAFATALDAYLAFKANMGFFGASRIWYLKKFDAYCAEHDRTVFDKDTVEGWVSVQLQRSGRYRSWMSYIRDVGRWMTMNGIPDAYVLSDRWKAQIVAAHPYLLSRREIELFFTAAAQIQTPCPWHSAILPGRSRIGLLWRTWRPSPLCSPSAPPRRRSRCPSQPPAPPSASTSSRAPRWSSPYICNHCP
jgi:hypothetical protein